MSRSGNTRSRETRTNSSTEGHGAEDVLLDELGDPVLSLSAKDIIDKARELAFTIAGDEADYAAYYVKVMERCLVKGEGWAAQERKRLSSMIDKGAVRPEKKTIFMIRRNILSALLTNYS